MEILMYFLSAVGGADTIRVSLKIATELEFEASWLQGSGR
jgi:hypothetical protein